MIRASQPAVRNAASVSLSGNAVLLCSDHPADTWSVPRWSNGVCGVRVARARSLRSAFHQKLFPVPRAPTTTMLSGSSARTWVLGR